MCRKSFNLFLDILENKLEKQKLNKTSCLQKSSAHVYLTYSLLIFRYVESGKTLFLYVFIYFYSIQKRILTKAELTSVHVTEIL